MKKICFMFLLLTSCDFGNVDEHYIFRIDATMDTLYHVIEHTFLGTKEYKAYGSTEIVYTVVPGRFYYVSVQKITNNDKILRVDLFIDDLFISKDETDKQNLIKININ